MALCLRMRPSSTEITFFSSRVNFKMASKCTRRSSPGPRSCRQVVCCFAWRSSIEGRFTGDLYVPAGGRRTSGPSPTDAVVTLYYSQLGSKSNVTLAVFHVGDYGISSAGDRSRIGTIGGPGGGEDPSYVHSHIEIYKGNVRLPALSARAGLRINPASVFCK